LTPEYACRRIPGPLEVDGDLSKPEWQGAEETSLVLVDTGEPPEQPTGRIEFHRPWHFGRLVFP